MEPERTIDETMNNTRPNVVDETSEIPINEPPKSLRKYPSEEGTSCTEANNESLCNGEVKESKRGRKRRASSVKSNANKELRPLVKRTTPEENYAPITEQQNLSLQPEGNDYESTFIEPEQQDAQNFVDRENRNKEISGVDRQTFEEILDLV